MKISYSHLVNQMHENPSKEILSKNLYQLGHEHDVDGNIFNMEFTPNRGDCLSINGLLRDLSVFYTIKENKNIYSEKLNKLEIDFTNLSKDTCPQISFLKLNIDTIPNKYKGSLNKYFTDLNLNKNNFFTDISNYISYETGQPTHCYDANKISGKLVFQELDLNEEFETLLGKKIKLTKKNAVFTLDSQIINLAGVVGGKETSCSHDTKSVIIECAFFKPDSIIGKSVKYDIHSDASHKFERYVDPECHEMVLRRFINLVSQHTNIKEMSFISYKYKENVTYSIPLNVKKINQIIGININEDQYLSYLAKLGFFEEDNLIKVPSYRSDIKTQNDLAEEVARVIGYNNIEKNELVIPKNKIPNKYDVENKLRYFLLDQGFYEVINSPFVSSSSENSIRVANPLDSNREYLRLNLVDSLLNNLLFNERRQKDSIKLFEIADIYSTINNKICKVRKLGIIASGRVGNNYEDFSKKITKQFLAKLFKETLPSEEFDFRVLTRDSLNTKIKNEIIYCESDIKSYSDQVTHYNEITKSPANFNQYRSISNLPFSKRDLSFSIKDQSKCKTLEKFILDYKDDLLKEVFIFDYFYNEKKQEIKIGFRFIFQSNDSTVTDKEVDDIMKVIIDNVLKFESISIPGYA